MLFRSIAVVGVGLLCASCVTIPPVAFNHPTATQQTMMTDRYACLQEAMGFVANQYGAADMVNGAIYDNCMALKGYDRDPNGRLVVPPDLVVPGY